MSRSLLFFIWLSLVLPLQAGTPTFSIAFSPTAIGPGGVSTLVYTINNSANTVGVSDVAFSNTLPTGVVVASGPNLISTCGGAASATAGGSTVSLSGVRLGKGESCTVSVDVTGSVPGTHTNTTGSLSTSAGDAGTANSTLTVDASVPGFKLSFSPNPAVNGRTTMTYTLDNSLNGSKADLITVTHTLPTGMVVANPPNPTKTSQGVLPQSWAPQPGGSSLSTQFAHVAAGATETFSVDVTVNSIDSFTTTTGILSQNGSNPSGTASATLKAALPTEKIALTKSLVGGPASPGSSVKLKYTLRNMDGSNVFKDITFTDDLNAAISGLAATDLPANGFCGTDSTLTGSSNITFTKGTLKPGEECFFEITVLVPANASPGNYTSSTSVITATGEASSDTEGGRGGGAALGSVTIPAVSLTIIVVSAPVLTKVFIDDPVTPGQDVTVRYTITNTDTANAASAISFNDYIDDVTPGVVIKTLPSANSCGSGSTFVSGFDGSKRWVEVKSANLTAGGSCTFDVILTIPNDLSPGSFSLPTEVPSATVNSETVYGKTATDNLIVAAAPKLSVSIVEDSANPGDTVTLQLDLSYSANAAADATGIGFTIDLDSALSGLVSTTATQSDICGSGSSLSGTSTLTFSGGSMSPGTSCSFSVTLQIPSGATPGTVTATSSTVSATTSGKSVSSATASDTLAISGLTLSKQFVGGPFLPGETATLRYTIANAAAAQAATAIQFSHNLSLVVSGLAASSLPSEPCGTGSSITGSTNLSLSGGSLQPGESCTFDVSVLIPSGTSDGTYNSVTSDMSATVNGNNTSTDFATAILVVDTERLQLTKSFTDDPVNPGGTVTLRYILTNLDASNSVSSIQFSDDFDAALSGLVATGLPASDICGTGSQISGTGQLSFTGGSLAAGGSCTFDVTLQIPSGSEGGDFVSTTSGTFTGTSSNGSASVNGSPATDTLSVNKVLFTKAFDVSVFAGDTNSLTYTIQNLDSSNSLDNLQFTDDLNSVISGLAAVSLPSSPLGDESSISGSTSLTFSKGSVGAGLTKSFSVTVQVPTTASVGSVQSTTSDLSRSGLKVATPASASLTVKGPTVSITATDAAAGEHSGTVDTATFQVSRDSGTGTLVVSLTVNSASTASSGDYNSDLTADLSFQEGETSKTVTLTPVDDTTAEPAETVQLDVASSSSYQISGSNSSATVTIAQNDFGVGNTNDSGEGSLRQAIENANSLGGNPTIDLSGISGTITLQSTLTVSAGMTLQGPGADSLTVSGDTNNSGSANSGDVAVLRVDSGITSSISGITIAKGFSTDKGGGIDNAGTLTINNSAVSGSAASNDGGGINNSGTLTIHNSTISGNTAGASGAGINNTGSLTITSGTISGNTATSNGGGIENSGTLTITSSTIIGNTAGTNGGGVNSSGSLTVTNSIVASNSATSDSDVSGTITTDTNNLIGVPSGKTIDDILDTTLANNGGKTLTHALKPNSPAINGGASGSLPLDTLDGDADNNTTEQISLDARGAGFSRIIGDSVDIGAVERQDIVAPTVAIGSPSSTLTSGGPVDFSVTYSGADTVNLTADKVTLNKTDTATGSVSVSNGTTATPTITISSITGDGSIGISIASGTSSDSAGNTDLGAGPSATFSVDNTAPTVTINQDSGQSDPATGSPINFRVIFNDTVSGFATGDVTLSGTAGATTGVVSEIAPNDGTTFNVAVSGMTSDGTVIASVSENVATDAAGNGNTTAASTDNTVTFQPAIRLTINQASISETVDVSTITATLNTAVGSQVTVTLDFNGTATGVGDYTASATQISIPANSLTGTATITSVEDLLIEGNETVIVDVSNVSNAAVDGSQQVTVSIVDNDTGSLGFQNATTGPSEAAGTSSVVVSLSTGGATLAQALMVDVDDLLTGTATSGGDDYTFADPSTLTFPVGSGNGATQSAILTIISEAKVEVDETVNFSLNNLTDPSSGSVSIATAANTHTVTIVEDDVATVAFAAGSSSVAEDAAAHTVLVKLSLEGGGTLQDPVVVNILDAGTGLATGVGTDYTLTTTQVTFVAGSGNGDTQTVIVTQAGDDLVERSEDVDLALTANSGAATIGTQSTHEVTITDSDSATVEFTSATSSVAEDNPAHTLNVKLNTASGVTLQDNAVFDINDPGSGNALGGGFDYSLTTTQVTFVGGSGNGNTKAVTLSQARDNLVEGSEEADLNITVNSGVATVGTQSTHKVTITDSDNATVEFAASGSSVDEDDPAHTLTVNLKVSTGVTLAKNVVINVNDVGTGTATGVGTDYTLSTTEVTFAAGSGNGDTQTVTVTQVSDDLVEGSENVDLTVTVNSGVAGIGAQSTHQVTIIDNDAPKVTADNISITSASGTGGAFKLGDTVTASWNNTSTGDNTIGVTGVTVDFSEFGGGSAVTATNSSDLWTATYAIVAGSIDATSKNVSVSATNLSGTTTTADATNATVDNVAPTVTDANITISGASGTGGEYKVGDTLTATWNNTNGGDNNSDTIDAVVVDFSAFGGGTAVTASASSGTWTATLLITEDGGGTIESSDLNISMIATDNAGNTKTVADTSNAALDNNTPEAPASLDLVASSDSGSSDADNITNDNTPTITGTAEANSMVELFHSGNTSLGTATVDSGGNWSITATTVPDGPQSLTVTSTDAPGNVSPASSALNVTIDTGNPTISDITTQTIDEDANTGAVAFSVGDSITAAGELTLVASSSDTTLLTDANVVLGGSDANRTVTATPESNKNGSVDVSITVSDASGNSASDTFTLAVTAVNDSPEVTATSGSVAYTENGAAIPIDDAVSVTDLDDTQLVSGSVSLTSGFTSGDTLAGTTTGTSITASYDATTGVLSLSGTDSLENYQTVLRTVTYSSTNEDPADSSTSRTVTFSVTDANAEASGAKTGSDTRTVSLTALSDAPVVTATSGSSAYTENGDPVAIDGAMVISDPDDTQIVSGSVSVTTGFATGDILAATTTGTGVTASYNSSTGVLSLTGTDTVANYQSVLQSVTYNSSSEDPTAASTARTITFIVTDANSDGVGIESGSAKRGIDVTPVNDAPVLTPAGPTLTTLTEDEIANDGHTVAAVLGSSINDVDTGAQQGIAIVSLNAGNGSWQFSVDNGANWSEVGAVAETSALLLRASDSIRFVPDGQNATAASLTYRAWDRTSGTEGTESDASGTGATTAFSSATDTVTLTVTAINDAPVLAAFLQSYSIVEQSPLALTASASDVDLPADTLTFSLDSGAPPGATISSSTGAFSWTPSEAQGPAEFEITVRVTDNGTPSLTATQTLAVSVSESNGEPALGGITDQVLNEGETMNVVLSASDNDIPANAVTFSLDSGPTGMTVDGASGLVSWPTGEGDGPGTYSVSVRVSDNGAPVLSVLRSFTVNVSEANNAPVISAIGNQTVNENESLNLQISANDTDLPTNQLSYALSSDAPAGATLNAANGQFAWTPTESQGPGTYTITVAVQDNGSPALTGTQSFQVVVEEVNQVPVLSSVGGILANEGQETVIPLVAFDADEPVQALAWALGADAPDGVTLDSSVPALRWTPTEAQGPGDYSFGIEVKDDGTPQLSNSSTVTIAVSEVNQAPVFAAVGPQATVVGETLVVNLSATDGDLPAQSLSYRLDTGAPVGATVDAASGRFTWTPSAAQGAGTYTITVLTVDNGTPVGSDSVSFQVDVTQGNHVPVLAQSVAQFVEEGRPLNVVLTATDPDVPGQVLTYELGSDAPVGVSINGSTGVMSWTPSEAQGPGSYIISVEVSDDGTPPLKGIGSVSVDVSEVNTAPSLAAIGDQTFAEGETLNLTAIATDTDAPANNLTFSLGVGESAGMAIDASSGVLSWTPEKTQSGATYDATVIVTDDGIPPLRDQNSFVVVVTAVNDAPTIGAISNQSTVEGVAVGPIAFTVSDVDNAPETLSVTGVSSNTALIAGDGIVLAGTGVNRTVSLQPTPGQIGTAVITLEVSDSAGATASVRFDVVADVLAPAVTNEMINPALLVGSSLTLEAQAVGTPPLSYQWFFEGTPLVDATQSTLALTDVQLSQAGAYLVEVTNSAGSDRKEIARVLVNAELGITTEPADLTVIRGETAVFEVVAGGTAPFSYQWSFDGNPVDGATSETLTLSNVLVAQSGSYAVEITNAAGAVSSRSAQLQVLVPPVINVEPLDVSVVEGGSVVFTVGVSGSKPLSYQWQKDGADIAGATVSKLALSPVSVADQGAYRVRVSNAGGTVESQEASLTVNVPAQVSDSQQDAVIAVGDPLDLTVNASGTPPLSYQWYLNGTPIDGATGVSFSIAAAQSSDTGKYTVVVSNPVGPIAGPVFNVTVIEAVQIVTQPENFDARRGDAVTMSVGVAGTGPFDYQWEFNGAIFSETSQPELILSGVQLNAAGSYRVRVSNLVSEALSQEVALTVTDQAQLSGLPERVDIDIGGELVLQVTAVGTPPFQYQWQLNGVNIDGATTDTYQISNVQSTDGGTYTVTVSDGGGATTSNSTRVIVTTPDLGLAGDAGSASATSAVSGDGSGSNVGASPVWMAWNSPGIGIASFSTRGSGFDTILTVYQGSSGNLEQVASDEDGGGFLTSATSFNTDTGVTYYVAVDGFNGAQGAVALRWDWFQTAEPLPSITGQPQSQTVLLGQPVEFSVVAESSSGSALSYQWFLDGGMIAGANALTLSLASAGAFDVGNYSVEVSSAGGTVTSSAAILQINLIATGSEGSGVDTVDKIGSGSQTVAGQAFVGAGDTAESSIVRRSTRPISRRSLLQGTRGEKLFSSRSAVKDAGEPNHCRVLGGASTWFIYEAPQNGALRVSTEGSSYDTVLAVYTSPTVDVDYGTLVEVSCNDNGGSDGKTSVMEFSVEAGTRYYLVVDGVNGEKGVVHFTYELSEPPALSQPTWFGVDTASGQVDETKENPVVAVGSGVEFRIGIGGLPVTAAVGYQWRRNGIDVKGGTSARLLLSSVSQADSGNYTVEVTTFAGTAESQGTRFTVTEPIRLLLSPDDQTVVAGRSAYFAVVPSGAGPFQYRWSLNGQALTGLTNAAVVLLDVQQSDVGVYEVAIADGVSQTSASATLTVLEGLLIVAQPVGQSVVAGQSVQLSVSAQGVEPLSYQWQLNGVDMAGATAAALELVNVQATEAGEYVVVVSNALETVASDPAVVTVESSPSSGVLLLSVTLGVGDTVTLEVDGGEGVNVEVQMTEDFAQWLPVETVRIQNSKVTFNDPNVATKSFLFYRLQVAP